MPLPPIPMDAVLHRIPGIGKSRQQNPSNASARAQADLLFPTYTFVPGKEAYPVGNS